MLQVYDNLAPGETLLRLPDDVTGKVVARFTSKLAELHVLLPDVLDTGRGMRLSAERPQGRGRSDALEP